MLQGRNADRECLLFSLFSDQILLFNRDQGLLISRELYNSVGGFKPIAIMEDVDIARRLGRKRIQVFNSRALTSAERYRRHGFFWRPLRNLCCLTLWFLGLSPELIARIYNR